MNSSRLREIPDRREWCELRRRSGPARSPAFRRPANGMTLPVNAISPDDGQSLNSSQSLPHLDISPCVRTMPDRHSFPPGGRLGGWDTISYTYNKARRGPRGWSLVTSRGGRAGARLGKAVDRGHTQIRIRITKQGMLPGVESCHLTERPDRRSARRDGRLGGWDTKSYTYNKARRGPRGWSFVTSRRGRAGARLGGAVDWGDGTQIRIRITKQGVKGPGWGVAVMGPRGGLSGWGKGVRVEDAGVIQAPGVEPGGDR